MNEKCKYRVYETNVETSFPFLQLCWAVDDWSAQLDLNSHHIAENLGAKFRGSWEREKTAEMKN